MKRFVVIIICILLSPLLFCTFPQKSSADEIFGVPVIENPEPVSDVDFRWEQIDDSHQKIKRIGIIEHFSTDGHTRCAINIGSTNFYVYEGGRLAFRIFVMTGGGACLCSFEQNLLIFYLVRDNIFYVFNLDNYEVKNYIMTDEKNGSVVCNLMREAPGDANIQNGYYVSNILGNRTFTAGHDKLYYVKDGVAINLYTTYIKVIYWSFMLIAFIIANIFFFLHYNKFVRKKNKVEAS